MTQNFLKTNDGAALIFTHLRSVKCKRSLNLFTHANIRGLMATHTSDVFPSLSGPILKEYYFSKH